jgi:hypothetical protein
MLRKQLKTQTQPHKNESDYVQHDDLRYDDFQSDDVHPDESAGLDSGITPATKQQKVNTNSK